MFTVIMCHSTQGGTRTPICNSIYLYSGRNREGLLGHVLPLPVCVVHDCLWVEVELARIKPALNIELVYSLFLLLLTEPIQLWIHVWEYGIHLASTTIIDKAVLSTC